MSRGLGDVYKRLALSLAVRRLLDSAGLAEVKIFASSGFDEFKIAEMITAGAAIDAFGVGTKVGVSADAPFLDVVYKLAQYQDRRVRKLSPHKVTLAGAKQVFRHSDGGGYLKDVIALRNEKSTGGAPLLEKAMAAGRCTGNQPSLEQTRAHCRQNLALLPAKYKANTKCESFPVNLSSDLEQVQACL